MHISTRQEPRTRGRGKCVPSDLLKYAWPARMVNSVGGGKDVIIYFPRCDLGISVHSGYHHISCSERGDCGVLTCGCTAIRRNLTIPTWRKYPPRRFKRCGNRLIARRRCDEGPAIIKVAVGRAFGTRAYSCQPRAESLPTGIVSPWLFIIQTPSRFTTK
jgi:hypothetical protein